MTIGKIRKLMKIIIPHPMRKSRWSNIRRRVGGGNFQVKQKKSNRKRTYNFIPNKLNYGTINQFI